MTQAERNAAITRKIEAYTAKFTVNPKAARAALKREGFGNASAAVKEAKHPAAA